jgi:hypothetical protein
LGLSKLNPSAAEKEPCKLFTELPNSQTVEEKQMDYYYYTRWTLPTDDWVDAGVYHSTWISKETPYEFTRTLGVNLIFIRQFETREELEEFAISVGLRNKQPNEDFCYC